MLPAAATSAENSRSGWGGHSGLERLGSLWRVAMHTPVRYSILIASIVGHRDFFLFTSRRLTLFAHLYEFFQLR